MDADRRCLAWLWLFLLAVYLLTMAGRLVSGDGETMYLTTKALLTRGELAIEARAETAEGREGRAYSKYGLGQSVAQAPFFVAGHAVGTLFGATDDRPTRFAVGMTNSVVTATLAGVFWLLLRQLGSGRGAATVASLVLGLATLAWPYARADFAEPLQATMLLLALYGLVRWRRQPTLAWAALTGAAAGAAVLTKVASVILLPPLGLYFAVALWERFGKPNPPRGRPSALRAFTRLPGAGRGTPADGSPVGVTRSPARQRPTWADLLAQVPPFPVEKGARGLGPLPHLAAAALPFALCVAFQAALNVYRFGSVAEFGYGDEPATGFTTPVLEGIGNLLFSSGKGLFFFAPPIVLGLAMLPQLARRYALEAAVVALIFLSELLYYARWWAWHGDWCWGPRYLVVTVPFLMVGWGTLLSAWRQSPLLLRAGAGLLAGAGFGVSLLGVAIDYGAYYSVVGPELGRGADVREARHVPELSPLLGHAWLARASLYDTAMALADGGAERERADNPYLQDYPWRAAYPELQPEAPERALGFDFWFAALRDRTPFLEYWSALVACWLALALVPLATRLRSAARCHTSEVAMPRPHTTERVVKVAPA